MNTIQSCTHRLQVSNKQKKKQNESTDHEIAILPTPKVQFYKFFSLFSLYVLYQVLVIVQSNRN